VVNATGEEFQKHARVLAEVSAKTWMELIVCTEQRATVE